MASKDLNIDDLAAYLHVTPQQVRKLAERGNLPGRRIGGAWRFSEAEVHVWLENRIGASDAIELEKVQGVVNRWSDSAPESVELSKLLHLGAIEIPLAARTKSSVVRRMCTLVEQTGMLWDAPRMVQAVLEREELHSTALDEGVALLHPRRPQASILAEPVVGLGLTLQPLPFGNRSGHLTDVFFLICSTDDRVHLQVLAKLSRILARKDFLPNLRECSSPSEVSSLVEEHEALIDESA